MRILTSVCAVTALILIHAASSRGQQPTAPVTPAAARNSPPLPPLPRVFETSVEKVRVSVVASGLVNPWSLAFLPTGEMLVTERPGRLRIIRHGTLDPKSIPGVPAVHAAVLGGLLEVALHPQFAANRLVYLSYSKGREDKRSTTALARGRLEDGALVDVRDVFVANTWSTSNTNYGGRIAFDRAGFLYLTVGERQEPERAQKPGEHAGKVLRLRDDGSAPPDNPFAGRAGYLPEIYSLGHRSPQGLAVHPQTGEVWENEHGPLGGDEVNIIRAGRNYGWPLVTFGTDYDGTKISDATSRADLEAPFMYWVPSIAISGLAFYTGDRFPAWKGSAFVGSMFTGRTRGTGHLQRITFTEGRPIQREPMLTELHQRIREVRQGPDGLLYLLTDEPNGALLKLEPAPELSTASMGHVHYYVRDVAASRAFWVALGGKPRDPAGAEPLRDRLPRRRSAPQHRCHAGRERGLGGQPRRLPRADVCRGRSGRTDSGAAASSFPASARRCRPTASASSCSRTRPPTSPSRQTRARRPASRSATVSRWGSRSPSTTSICICQTRPPLPPPRRGT